MPVASSRLSEPAKAGTRPAASGPTSTGTRSSVTHEPDDDHGEQPRDRALERPVPAFLQRQQPERDHPRHQAADRQGQPEEQVQRHRAADDLGQVGGDRDDLRLHPEPDVDPAREGVAADLGQVAARREAELGRQRLDQHRGDVGRDDHPEQQVAVLGAGGEVGGEVAGVDVGDRGDERRPEQRGGAQHPGRAGGGGAHGAHHASTSRSTSTSTCTSRPCTRRVSDSPRAWSRPSNRTQSGPPASAFEHDQGQAGDDAEVVEVRQRGGVPVLHPLDPELPADRGVGEPGAPALDVGVAGPRDRVAVRVVRGAVEQRVDAVEQPVGHGVLQGVRLVVHLVRGEPDDADEEGLEQPVPADDVPGVPGAVRRQRGAVVRCARRARARRAA